MLTQQNEHLHTKIKGRDKEYGILAKSLITHTNKISIAHERHEDLLTKLDTMANEWSNEDIYNKNNKKNNKNNKTEGRKEKDVSAIDMLCNSLKEAIGNVQLEAEKVASLLETKNNSSGTSTGATGATGSTEKVSKNEETKIDSKKMSPKQGKRRNKKKKNKKK